MLNTFKIGGNTTNVSFTSPSSGIIQKSHPKSKFINLHNKSPLADKLLDCNKLAHIGKDKYDPNYMEITVLQIMVFGSDWLLMEIVNNEYLTDINI